MAKKVLDLQLLLESIVGTETVYFQPPPSMDVSKRGYPAIIFALNDIDNDFADNNVYRQSRSYTITVLDRDPESEIVDKISLLPRSRYDRSYRVDGLNHSVFTLYF